jgi:hypothetical protein
MYVGAQQGSDGLLDLRATGQQTQPKADGLMVIGRYAGFPTELTVTGTALVE